MIIWPLRGVVALAVVLAWLVARRATQHRPIAIGLGLSLTLDVTRAVTQAILPDSFDLALYCAPAALSIWVAALVFRLPRTSRQNQKLFLGLARALLDPMPAADARRILRLAVRISQIAALAAWIDLAVVADLLDPRLARTWLPPLALAVSVLVQAVFALSWRLASSLTVAQACALVLLAGDVTGLLGPAGPLPWPRALWWAGTAQAALVALVLVVVQGVWLRRWGGGRGFKRARARQSGPDRSPRDDAPGGD